MKQRTCLHCVSGMMPAGIDPIFGPVYRICPLCHTTCVDCDGMAIFPAITGYTVEAVINVVYHLGYELQHCDRCFGIAAVWPSAVVTDD